MPSGERIASVPSGEPSDTSGPRSTSSRTSGRRACSTGRVARHQPPDATTARIASAAATAHGRLARGSWSSLRDTGIFRRRQSPPQSQSAHQPASEDADACLSAGNVAAACGSLCGVASGNRLQSGSALDHRSQNLRYVFTLERLLSTDSNSYSTQPKAQMSVRLSTALPRLARDSCTLLCPGSRLASSPPGSASASC